jgi:serine O-acetyltransferase
MQCFVRDVKAVQANDPAARSQTEIVLTYPGLHALWMHRAAHALYRRERFTSARVLSHTNRFLTGIEIHPGAKLGQGVFIDHGMGVVIGETATVGDGCVLFKGVVLGGTTHARNVRHPQVGKDVVIGTNACILGAIEIGDGARIGSGSVVIRPVPDGSTVVGVPGRIVRAADHRTRFDDTLDHADLPDPVVEMMRSLRGENERLRTRLERLEERLGVHTEDDDHDDHLIDPALATRDLPPQHGG